MLLSVTGRACTAIEMSPAISTVISRKCVRLPPGVENRFGTGIYFDELTDEFWRERDLSVVGVPNALRGSVVGRASSLEICSASSRL